MDKSEVAARWKQYKADVKSGKIRGTVIHARWQMEAGAPVTTRELEAFRKHDPKKHAELINKLRQEGKIK